MCLFSLYLSLQILLLSGCLFTPAIVPLLYIHSSQKIWIPRHPFSFCRLAVHEYSKSKLLSTGKVVWSRCYLSAWEFSRSTGRFRMGLNNMFSRTTFTPYTDTLNIECIDPKLGEKRKRRERGHANNNKPSGS